LRCFSALRQFPFPLQSKSAESSAKLHTRR
jgi:hypothetical protein